MVSTRQVDCLVIGAGPGGSVAAREMAARGHSTLLIEKRPEIGVPIRCGEGISSKVLDLIGMAPEPSFIGAKVEGARIISPSGTSVTLGKDVLGPEDGYVLRRDRFDRELARRAVGKGSDLLVMCEALGLKRDCGSVVVPCRRLGERIDVTAKVIIGADGFEAQVGRWAGLDTTLALRDFDSCIQYQMVGVDNDARFCDFYIGRRYAPGGYVWCFPKGNGLFNVGLGINGSMMEGPATPKRSLDAFIAGHEEFRAARTIEVNAGGVSVGLPLERTVSDNVVLVGDAARMIDPLTGGGIYNACFSAIKAAEVVSAALEGGSCSEKDLLRYERAWRDPLEPVLVRNYIAKEMFLNARDATLDSIIGSISRIGINELSTAEILRAISTEHPDIAAELTSLGNS